MPTYSLLALSFATGQTLISQLDLQSLQLTSNCLIPSIHSQRPNSTALALLKNGDYFSNFRELTDFESDRVKNGSFLMMATFGKQAASVPCLIELAASKVTVSVVKPKSESLADRRDKLCPIHGYSLVKPSTKKTYRKAPRLVTFDESGSAYVYKVGT